MAPVTIMSAAQIDVDQQDPAIRSLLDSLAAEDDPSAFGLACLILEERYDLLISQVDFASALQIVQGLSELARLAAGRPPACGALLKESRLRLADRAHLARVVAALDAHPDCDQAAFRRLLLVLPGDIVPFLIEGLGVLRSYPMRKLVCELIAELGADRLEDVGAGVLDERWFVARNVALVLGRIGGLRVCSYLERAAKRPEAAVRRQALEALALIESADAARILRVALGDPSQELRLKALNILLRRRDAEVGALVARRVRDPEFLHVPAAEQRAWLRALAQTSPGEALSVLRGMIERPVFLSRGAAGRLRLLAVAALAEAVGPEAEALLEELTRDGDRWVRDVATLALSRSRGSGTHRAHDPGLGKSYDVP